MVTDKFQFSVIGHVHAQDKDTGEVLCDQFNAIHPQNMARVIARALAHESNSHIFKMVLGNGGTHIDAGLNIKYLPPNTVGTNASLYNKTYEEVVDDSNAAVGSGNSAISSASPAPAITSVVTVVLELTADEPAGQAASDGTTTNPDSTFTFDELGLVTSDSPNLLLSHIVFSPIEKTSNRSIVITYTLTIQVS
jgi:hypothetical protein